MLPTQRVAAVDCLEVSLIETLNNLRRSSKRRLRSGVTTLSTSIARTPFSISELLEFNREPLMTFINLIHSIRHGNLNSAHAICRPNSPSRDGTLTSGKIPRKLAIDTAFLLSVNLNYLNKKNIPHAKILLKYSQTLEKDNYQSFYDQNQFLIYNPMRDIKLTHRICNVGHIVQTYSVQYNQRDA